MSSQPNCQLSRDSQDPSRVRAKFAPLPGAWIGRKALIRMQVEVEVTTSGGINKSKELGAFAFDLDASGEVLLSENMSSVYAIDAAQMKLKPHLTLQLDGREVYDSEADPSFRCEFPRFQASDGEAAELIEPKDSYNLAANLKAIPPKNRLIAKLIIGLGSLFLAFNSFLGLHDQFVPESQAYFYDQSGSDGGESPLMKSLFGSGGAGVALYLALRAQLRKYMTFELKKTFKGIDPQQSLSASDLVHGIARVALTQTRLRVVACNRACGEYTRRDGTKTRTVSFKTPFRAVVLYEQHLAHVPAGTPIEHYLSGEIQTGRVFASLYPPVKIGSSHGVDLHWEVQLIHPELVDQELSGPEIEAKFGDYLV